MNVIKFIGKALALPIKIVMFVIELGLFPIKLLTNWLKGYGKYNKLYLKYGNMVIKHMIEATKRGENPALGKLLGYMDDNKSIIFFNIKENPYIVINNRTGEEPEREIIE